MGKRLVEDSITLDLAWLMRLAPIRAGRAGSGQIRWWRDGNSFGSAHFRLDLRETENGSLLLRYWPAGQVGERKPTRQVVTLTALPQHFGGHRFWFRCPVTGKCVRTLHLPPGGEHFASRKAWGLAYRVERMNRFDRAFEKLFRAQRRLCNPQGLGTGLERPKGMWQRTFAKHAMRFVALDLNCAEKISAMIERA